MPLPANGAPWPPPALDGIGSKMAEWSAWYSGDPADLRNVYASATAGVRVDRPAQYRGGIGGAIARMWWGRPVGDLGSREDHLHVPVASDLCQASADLLFSEPPTLTVEDTTTQDRLDELTGDGMLGAFAETAEITAALGTGYLRVTWDEAISPDAPFLTSVDADGAWPEFRWGRLVAVTFWRVVREQGQRVWRHLERHELDTAGVGVILHGLFEGSVRELGQAIPLAEDPSTASITVDADGLISTQSPGLAVTFVPNQRPSRRWRTHPLGRHLGRSDLDGVEPLMDALDEVYSSWMRDIRLAKSRIIVPEYMLTNLGAGKGAAFDADREVYSTVAAAPTSEVGITPHQFEIRFAEHRDTAQNLLEQILRSVGYSAQTFGEGDNGGMKTATEVTSEQNRSYMTRDRKIRLWRPAIGDAVEKLLAVDAALFRSRVQVERPDVAFGDAVQADPLALAQTAQALRTAQAASTATLVRAQHPDWDEAAIADEVAAIHAEQGMAVPDPAGSFPPAGAGA